MLADDSDEHIEEQQIEQHHEHQEEHRREVGVPALHELVVVRVARHHDEESVGGFEDGGELGVLESEERVAPDRETEQHDGEHEEEEASVSGGGGDHIRENGEFLVELEELQETQEDDERVDAQHHFEFLVNRAELLELSNVVRIVRHQIKFEHYREPVEDINE